MIYYRVKKEFDNYTRYKWDTRQKYYGYVRPDGILIGKELYTETERSKISNASYFFEKVEISKNKTYWCFGARF